MKKRIFIIVVLLVALTLVACGGNNNAPANNAPAENSPAENAPANNAPANNANEPAEPDEPAESNGDSPFPMPDGATIMMSDDTMANIQVDATLDELVEYYRAELVDGMGLTEREILTSITDGVVSFVFDGHESGQALVVQMVDLGNGTINVNIRFEDV